MISYDLHRGKESDYETLWSAIESNWSSYRLLKSTWLIKTNQTSNEIFNTLKVYIADTKIKIFINRLPTDWDGNVSNNAFTWIKDHE
jgi:hypothetical protein